MKYLQYILQLIQYKFDKIIKISEANRITFETGKIAHVVKIGKKLYVMTGSGRRRFNALMKKAGKSIEITREEFLSSTVYKTKLK